jgi:hypothetical protein
MQELILSNNYQISNDAWHSIFEFVTKYSSHSLKKISLSNCLLDLPAVKAIADGISTGLKEKKNKVLECLDLNKSYSMGAPEIQELMRCFFTHFSETIQNINLSDSRLNDKKVFYLISGIVQGLYLASRAE